MTATNTKSKAIPQFRAVSGLELPLVQAKSAATIVRILVDRLLEQEHYAACMQVKGCRSLLIDEDDVEATAFALRQLELVMSDLEDKVYCVLNESAAVAA